MKRLVRLSRRVYDFRMSPRSNWQFNVRFPRECRRRGHDWVCFGSDDDSWFYWCGHCQKMSRNRAVPCGFASCWNGCNR